MRVSRSMSTLGLALALSAFAPSALAQFTATGHKEPSAEEMKEARTRFERALELFEDGQLDAALTELRRAYELAPTYRILYNVGVVYQQLKDYARAYDTFERYVAEGGADIPADRSEDVKKRIERIEGRVAYLLIGSTEPADVSIDDVPIGRTPLVKAVRVNSGQRRVSLTVAGRPAQSRVVELAGGEKKSVDFDFHIAAPAAAAPQEKTSPVPIVAWSVTGALVVAGATTGVLALGAASDYDTQAAQLGISDAALSSTQSRKASFAIATDALLGAALVSAAISVYFTLKPPGEHRSKAAAWLVTPLGAQGRF